jgi:hypothetical protein
MIYYFFLIWSLFFLFLFFSLVFLLIFYWFSISFFNQILWCIIFSYLILMFFYFFSFVKVIFLFNLTSNQKTFVAPPFIFYFYFHPYSFNCILYLRSFFTSNLMTQIMNLEYWWGLKSFLLLLIFFFNFIIWHYFFIYIKRLPLWFSSIFFLGYLDFMTWTTGFAS